jgi:NAD(P)-dependent dehydrogenase (short-subunit alcohol dehydrogenase family)
MIQSSFGARSTASEVVAGHELSGKTVVSLTSGTHRLSDIHFDDIQYQHRPYDKWEAYAQSKTADTLLAVSLTRHFGEQGITANAVNPGGVLTGLQQHLTPEERRARYYGEAGNLLPEGRK